MKTRAYADEGRHTMWARLWYALHGQAELTPREERAALWSRLADLELAAQELSALEQVEAARSKVDDDR